MKRSVLAVACAIIPALMAHAMQPSVKDNGIASFGWGARIGFAATSTYMTDIFIDGHSLSEYTQDTQVGNFASVQLRLNSRKLLFQTGVGLSFNKSSFIIDKNSWDKEAGSRNELTYSYSMKSLLVPLQIGYHFVNQPPYSMSVFTGPCLRYTPDKYYSAEYTNLAPAQYRFTESPNNLTVGWTLGLSVQIGRTFLDFEYEATISKMTRGLYATNATEPDPNYTLDRRVGIISFSYGIMF